MNRVFLIGIAAVAMIFALVLWRPWGGNDAGEVVVYTSVDDVFARPIAETFQKQTGIAVHLVPDTEETKSTGLVNRLMAEKARPQADVFWSGDPVRAEMLKKQGVATPYKSPQADGLPPEFSDPENYWTGFSARARVLIYNKDNIPAGSEPRSIMDLVDAQYQGRTCLANPLFGTTSMHAASLFALLGEEDAKHFFNQFLANGGQMASSNGDVRRRVAEGSCSIGVTDTDDANVALLDGRPVGIVYPDADGMGTLIIPNAAVLIANGPNPEAGKQFIDFLLRPQTETALAQSAAAQIPLREGVPTPEGIVTLDHIQPMAVDYTTLADRLETLGRGFLKDWVDRAQ